MKPFRVSAFISIALGLLCVHAQASGKFITFQVAGATQTDPRTITNTGEVVGYFGGPANWHGFVRATDGTITIVDVPGAADSFAVAMGSDGTIVGNYINETGKGYFRGFVRSPDGQYADLIAPHGARDTGLSSLSKAGWIAGTGQGHVGFFGFLRDPKGHYTEFGYQLQVLQVQCANAGNTTAGAIYDQTGHGFVRTPDGTLTQFDPSGGWDTNVSAINDAGTAVGSSFFSSGNGGFGFTRASDGTISKFVVPGGAVQYTVPMSINKSGVIAGESQNKNGGQDGFIRAPDGKITRIDVPGGTHTRIVSINDKGQVAGSFTANGIVMGFIWKP